MICWDFYSSPRLGTSGCRDSLTNSRDLMNQLNRELSELHCWYKQFKKPAKIIKKFTQLIVVYFYKNTYYLNKDSQFEQKIHSKETN